MTAPQYKSTRRLPPLYDLHSKLRYKSIGRTVVNPITPSKHSHEHLKDATPSMMITGHGHIASGKGINAYTRSAYSSKENMMSEKVSTESIVAFLNEEPQFLHNYVRDNVDISTLKSWINQKALVYTASEDDPQRENMMEKLHLMHNTRSGRLLQNLLKDFHHMAKREHVLFELSRSTALVVQADGFNLYLKENNEDLRLHDFSKSAVAEPIKIKKSGAIAGHVAATESALCFGKAELKNENFSLEVVGFSVLPEMIMAFPLMDSNNQVLGVVEMYRSKDSDEFTQNEQDVAQWHLSWSDVLLQMCEVYSNMKRQRKLNEFLLTVTKSIFQDIVSMDTVILKIMTYAKHLVNADRASLFLLDNRTNELYARIFDTGSRSNTEHNPIFENEIRFPIGRGVAGHVASTGQILNIENAYSDKRFNRDIDLHTGYTTRTLLCMPIYIRGSIIGVVQMVNKVNGTFTKSDEESFETFAIYCGLALHHAKLYDKIRKSEQKHRVALEMLSYHSQCSVEEMQMLEKGSIPDYIPELSSYNFSPWSVTNDQKPSYIIYMFQDLFSLSRFDVNDLIRFTLTVRKNYRNVPYHNWSHAFSVAHAMYTIIKNTKTNFSGLETLALFVGSICHDLDHRGKTNAFMVKSASPLAAIYSTSTMEHHHFNQTVTILQHEGHNIFKFMTSEEYKEVLGGIRHCILATDLALFFGNRSRLQDIVNTSSFNWDEKEHRYLVMSVMMTSADLCAMYKTWDLQYDLVHVIMEEFWQQGDIEKSQGVHPMPMMDRDKRDELPQLEVGFIQGICIPCYEILTKVVPEAQPMLHGAQLNLERWKELASQTKKKNEEAKPAAENKIERTHSSKKRLNQANIEIVRDTESNILIGKLTNTSLNEKSHGSRH